MGGPLCIVSQATIDSLPAGIHRHSYDRTKVKAGIVHFGVGAFHRSHQAVYLDRVLHNTKSTEWGICGVGLLPFDLPMKDAMSAQDCLYTVNEMSPDGSCNSSLVQAMVEYMYGPDDFEAVTLKLIDPSIKIVSLTITEGGYFMNNKGQFLVDHPSIVKDLSNPSSPRTAIGFIVEALERRRQANMPAFTVMSCDNLCHNGHQAKTACLGYAKSRDPQLAEWIAANVSFPNSMVDRITPATNAAVRERLTKLTGVQDRAPVIAEDFIQWVLEDNFKYGRPAYETADVTMVADVLPYEEAKIRLLNGSHTMISYPSFLAGERKVDIAIKDPVFAAFIKGYLYEEAGKYIPNIPGMDMDKYKEALLHRFGNSAVGDQIARLCMDGGSKIPGFLYPTLKANLEANGTCPRVAFLLASYSHYIRSKIDSKGEEFELREPSTMDILAPIIASSSPTSLIETEALVGDAASYPLFVKDYLTSLDSIQKEGVYTALEKLNASLL